MKFIKLTGINNVYYLNSDAIVACLRSQLSGYTTINVVSGEYDEVKETPEEILALINGDDGIVVDDKNRIKLPEPKEQTDNLAKLSEDKLDTLIRMIFPTIVDDVIAYLEKKGFSK